MGLHYIDITLTPAVNTKRNKAAEWIFQSIQPAADILLSAGVEALKVFTERVEDGQTEWINNGGEMSKGRRMRQAQQRQT